MKIAGGKTPLLAKKAYYKVASIYAIVAGTWILLSDRILFWYFEDSAQLTHVQTVKGWFFVFSTAFMLAWLIRHYTRHLEQERDLLENIISNIPLYVFWKDREGRHLGCNQRYASVTGVGTKENIVGKTDHDLSWRREEAELIWQRDRAIIKKGEALLDVEETHLQADNQKATFLTSRVPLKNESDNIIGLLGIYADITLRKRDEKALRESEERFRSIFESAAAPMAIIAIDGTLLQANRAAYRFLGYAEDVMQNFNIDNITHPADREKTHEQYEELKSGNRSFIDYEKRYLRKDGSTVWGHTTMATVRDPDGSLLYFVALTQDITERQKADQMKDEMLSAVSHEMSTPLTVMLGFTEFMLGNEVDKVQQREYLEIIHKESDRLKKMIDNLLNLQQLRAGFGRDNFKTVSIHPLLKEVSRPLEIFSNKHTIVLDCATDLPPFKGDLVMLSHALENLLSNAIKYSPDGGGVTLGARHEDGCVILWVKDEGTGIPPQALDQIFDRFFRIDSKDGRSIGGSGLGLPLVKEIAKLHNGRVWAESTIGEGSTFYMSLPIGDDKNQYN